YSSRLLADLGATVVKVEAPGGDPLRGSVRMFRAAQANKQSLALDLRRSESTEIVDRLIRWSDVVHHNMRPRVALELGLTAERVQAVNPAAIFGMASGWASNGP
ncbi:MAG TPA: CoA transferase, partial [Ilumatobacteraceae bacterium]|nr:CoA transferase [Ilumatobacteraceae bacterium]